MAAVLTYVRRSWGNVAAPISASEVTRVRVSLGTVDDPVTAAQLQPLLR
jgi:hypothetical protein